MKIPKPSEAFLKKARPHYFAMKKALHAAARALGAPDAIGMMTTTLLRLYTDQDRPARLALNAMAAALAEQHERVSLEDMEHFRQVYLATRNGDAEALAALFDVSPEELQRAAQVVLGSRFED